MIMVAFCNFVKYESHDVVECQKFHIKMECRECVPCWYFKRDMNTRKIVLPFFAFESCSFAFDVYVRILNFVYATSLL